MGLATLKKIKKGYKKQVNLEPTIAGPDIPQTNINEGKKSERHAVIAFTDCNPPTEGHYHLANTVRYHASKNKGEPMLFLSHKENRRTHPMPYSQKFKVAQDAFGADLVHNTRHEDLKSIVHSLHGRFQHVTVVANQGELPDLRSEIGKHNGTKYNFKTLNFVSAGKKNPDKAGAAKIHGKKMRDAATEGDKNTFKAGLPKSLRKRGADVYGHVRRGLGIRESINEHFDLFVDKIINSQLTTRGSDDVT